MYFSFFGILPMHVLITGFKLQPKEL